MWEVGSSARPRAGPEHSPIPPARPQVGFSMVLANPLTRGRWSWRRTSSISMVSDWRFYRALGIQPSTPFPTPQSSPLPAHPWKFCTRHRPGLASRAEQTSGQSCVIGEQPHSLSTAVSTPRPVRRCLIAVQVPQVPQDHSPAFGFPVLSLRAGWGGCTSRLSRPPPQALPYSKGGRLEPSSPITSLC